MPVVARIATGKSHLLQDLPLEEMEKILADPKRASAKGWPLFCDSLGRLWPAPSEGIELVNSP